MVLGGSRPNWRAGLAVLIVLLLLPSAIATATSLAPSQSGNDAPDRSDAQQVTFVSSQHGSIVAIHTPTGERLWRHDAFEKYYDVDPLNDSAILFSARIPDDDRGRSGIVMNWRTGDVLETFELPVDTHDVDRIRPGRYVVADKEDDRIFVYEPATESLLWTYNFSDYFPAHAGGPEGDWTHMNDVDVIDEGSSFLADPRNFNRVMLINRSTKEREFVLGTQNDPTIVNHQHNPVLLSRDPPTILVADSGNNRIVEYQQRSGEWEATWGYRGSLQWPRDADRLPNGNTMITDSANNRVLVVSPDHRVVWERSTDRWPYDIERLPLGDEPAGPTMASQADRFGSAFDVSPDPHPLVGSVGRGAETWHFYASRFLPLYIGQFEFYTALAGVTVAVLWTGFEALLRVPERIGDRFRGTVTTQSSSLKAVRDAIVVSALVGIVVGSLLTTPTQSRYTGQLVGLAVLLVGVIVEISFAKYQRGFSASFEPASTFVLIGAALACGATGGLMFVIADRAGIFLYYGVGILLFWQGLRLWAARPVDRR